jgi:hypothetical protein
VGAIVMAARVVVGIAALDLAARQVARGSLWGAAGIHADTGTVLVVALVAAIVGLGAAWRRAWRGTVSLVLGAAFAAGLFAQLQLGARLQSDGFYYFSYLRSLWFDGDVNFTNDYRLLGLTAAQHQFLYTPTRTGHAQTAWAIGPALVWSPFFAAGHVVAQNLRARGHDVAADGTSYPYRQAICVAGLFYGLLGAWCCWRLARLFFTSAVAAGATLVTIAGSFMLWYLVKEPSMSHAPSMAAVAAFVWAWAATGGIAGDADHSPTALSWRRWAFLGLGAGLMMAIRWQNALFVLLPVLELTAGLPRRNAPALVREEAGRRSGPAVLRAALAFGVAAVAGFAPQMLAWQAIYGRPLAVSPVGPRLLWTDPQLVDVLWSSRNGLFALSPALYAAAIGLFIFARVNRRVGLASLAIALLMVYLNASVEDWWGGAGFGGRRFDSLVPLFVLGLSALFTSVRGLVARRPALVTSAIFAALLLWNLTFMNLAVVGRFRIGQPLAFASVAGDQAAVAHRWFGHPFSWPVNLAFSARYGVEPWRYDTLGPGRFLGDPSRPYGRIDVGTADAPFLRNGWHAPEQDVVRSFRWAEREAGVLIPLDHPAALRLQIAIQPFGYPGAPPQHVTVVVNGHSHPQAAVPPGWNTLEAIVDEGAWRAGVNGVVLKFAWSARPADVGLGGDVRELAAQVDYIRITK